MLDLGCGTGTLALAALESQPAARITGLDADGKLPGILSDAGLRDVTVTDRLRTPIGTLEVVTAERPA